MKNTYLGPYTDPAPRSSAGRLRLVPPIESQRGLERWTLLARHLWTSYGSRLARYGVVGVTGVAVSTVLLYLLAARLGLNHLIAAAIASEVSIITNFALNDLWTFRDRQQGASWLQRGVRYNTIALGGMAIQLGVLAALTLGLGLHYILANFIAIGFATVSNYVLNTRFTWTASERQAPAGPHLQVVGDY